MYDVNESMGKLLQLYRHDILNVLQVVGGMAQLNKTDRLMSYIRSASEEVQQFGRFIGCGDPRVALLVYETVLQDRSGSYLIQVSGSLPLLPHSVLYALEKTLPAVQERLNHLGEYALTIHILGGAEPELRFHIHDGPITPGMWEPVVERAFSCGLSAHADYTKGEITLILDKCGTDGVK